MAIRTWGSREQERLSGPLRAHITSSAMNRGDVPGPAEGPSSSCQEIRGEEVTSAVPGWVRARGSTTLSYSSSLTHFPSAACGGLPLGAFQKDERVISSIRYQDLVPLGVECGCRR
jgi:hypothetical protein